MTVNFNLTVNLKLTVRSVRIALIKCQFHQFCFADRSVHKLFPYRAGRRENDRPCNRSLSVRELSHRCGMDGTELFHHLFGNGKLGRIVLRFEEFISQLNDAGKVVHTIQYCNGECLTFCTGCVSLDSRLEHAGMTKFL